MKQETTLNGEENDRIQVKANVRKLQNIWATPAEMDAATEIIHIHVLQTSFGLCHGSRHGQEVRLVNGRLGADVEVLETDISPSANSIEDMTQPLDQIPY